MIIGKGLIASIFLKNNFLDKNFIIFASGVSNSQEVLLEAFDREFDLIRSFVDTSKCFIYFSTISIFDPSMQKSQYIQHKINVERYISNHFKNYIIFRLGQVIGNTQNPKLISNFLFNHIANQKSFDLWSGAERIFMDIEDVYMLVKYFMHHDHNQSIINLVHNNSLPVSELVKYF
jgi:nucleoside-diphosphate-sugar epimerase